MTGEGGTAWSNRREDREYSLVTTGTESQEPPGCGRERRLGLSGFSGQCLEGFTARPVFRVFTPDHKRSSVCCFKSPAFTFDGDFGNMKEHGTQNFREPTLYL